MGRRGVQERPPQDRLRSPEDLERARGAQSMGAGRQELGGDLPGTVGRAEPLAGLQLRHPPPCSVRPRNPGGAASARGSAPPRARKAGWRGACQAASPPRPDGVLTWYKGIAESNADDFGARSVAELKETVLTSSPPSTLDTGPRPRASRNPLKGPGCKEREGRSGVSRQRTGGSTQPILAPRRAGLQPIAARGSAPGRSWVGRRPNREALGR